MAQTVPPAAAFGDRAVSRWMRGLAVYVGTGNAVANPENFGYADKVVRLGLDLGVQGADGPNISSGDFDFGSTRYYIKRRTARLSLLL
jgi:hypothetical protein